MDAEAAFFWLTDTEVLIGQRLWTSSEQWKLEHDRELSGFPADLVSICGREQGILSYDMDAFCRQFDIEKEEFDKFQIRSLMLIPVKGLDGSLSMILGAYNLKHRCVGTGIPKLFYGGQSL